MKKIQSTLLFLVISLISLNLSAQSEATKEYQGITIRQNNKVFELPAGKSKLKLKREAFDIEFDLHYRESFNEWYNWTILQVSATQFPESLMHFNEGKIAEENPFFSPGSGLAGYPDAEYEELIISNYGCHYIYYDDDSNKRATILEKKSDKLIRFKWTIDNFYIIEDYFSDNKQMVSVEESDIKKMYLMIYIDEDDDDNIDPGEYHLVHLKFK